MLALLRNAPVWLLASVLAVSHVACSPSTQDSDSAPPPAPFELTDQRGQSFGSQQLAGRVWVGHVFTSGCGSPCAEAMEAQGRLQQELFNHPQVDDLWLVSLGLNPVDDTVAARRRFADEQAKAYDERWRFLGGSPEELARVAQQHLALPMTGDDSLASLPEVAHLLALVDRDGRHQALYDARQRQDIDRLLNDIETALAESTSIAKAAKPSLPTVAWPDGADNPAWLTPRADAQRAASQDWTVRHDFAFTDQVAASGITFVHRVVDDAGRNYKGVHYDHGNGLSVADVDGDGHEDLYFTTQLGRNQLWRNLGDGTFEDWTARAGVGLGERVSVTASFADVDNDGDADLFVTTVNDGNVLFVNRGDGTFDDVTETSGLSHVGHSSAAEFFDFDNDGNLDLYVANIGQYSGDDRGRADYDVGFEDAFSGHLFPERTEHSLLYKGRGDGTFEDVTEAMGLDDGSWTGDATPIDVDGDGDQDLYVLDMQGDDDYYENQGGEGFVRRSDLFPRTPWGSMGVKAFDWNADGRLDLYITDMHSDMSERIGPEREKLKSRMQWSEEALGDSGPSTFGNAFYQQRADGTFEEVSNAIGAENYWPWGLSAGDLNADGFDDVILTSSMNFPWRYGLNSVLLNDAGQRFVDAEVVLGVEPRYFEGRTVTPWFELDCGGDLTAHALYTPICQGHSDWILVEGALGTRAAALFDLDGDGDLDIVTNEFHSAPQVLINDLAQRHTVRALEVDLVGSQSNRDGLGARVTVSAGGRDYLKVYDGQSGYLSQSSQRLYFGLGDSEVVDRILVQWPSGQEQVVEGPIDVPARRTIEEP